MADIFFIKRPLEGGTLKFLRRKLNRWYNCVLTTAADKTIEWDAALAIPLHFLLGTRNAPAFSRRLRINKNRNKI